MLDGPTLADGWSLRVAEGPTLTDGVQESDGVSNKGPLLLDGWSLGTSEGVADKTPLSSRTFSTTGRDLGGRRW